MTDVASTPHVGPQHCPKCDATAVKAAVLTSAYVYLRCQLCGEVWVIPERRELPRDTPGPRSSQWRRVDVIDVVEGDS